MDIDMSDKCWSKGKYGTVLYYIHTYTLKKDATKRDIEIERERERERYI